MLDLLLCSYSIAIYLDCVLVVVTCYWLLSHTNFLHCTGVRSTKLVAYKVRSTRPTLFLVRNKEIEKKGIEGEGDEVGEEDKEEIRLSKLHRGAGVFTEEEVA